MTRLSAEQVTIVQLQGSTEVPSQLSSTPWGSTRDSFIPIKACTEIKINPNENSTPLLQIYEGQRHYIQFFTFKVYSFGVKNPICRSPKPEKCPKIESSFCSSHSQMNIETHQVTVKPEAEALADRVEGQPKRIVGFNLFSKFSFRSATTHLLTFHARIPLTKNLVSDPRKKKKRRVLWASIKGN